MTDLISRQETFYDRWPSTFLFHKRFRRLCRQAGYGSATAAADLLGVHRNTICAWNAGTKLPKMHHLVAISRAFSVPVDYLCGMDFYDRIDLDERFADDADEPMHTLVPHAEGADAIGDTLSSADRPPISKE